MKRAALHNLGCKVNAYETDAMTQLLEKAGYQIVSFHQPADVYIVNTCSVTNMADRKSRQMLHKAKKMNPEAVVVATGCYVQTATEKVMEDMSIDLVVGNNRKKEIVSILEEYFEKHNKDAGNVIDINHTAEYEDLEIATVTEHTRAHMKIQDGCNNFCSYCIIPYARGRIRSRSFENIKSEMIRLAAGGFKEIVLTGINLGCYSDGEKKLIDVIEMAEEVEGIERIRLGSLDPEVITKDFVERLSNVSKICPHFHLSMQSGCDKTLRAMNRHYTSGEYYEKCCMLREHFDNPALTTDVIVGFPKETEEDYSITREFVKKVAFAELHVFKYSLSGR
jgi:threonylcarbamoyladenosine tRNA methylthiotransferase MtaB